MVYEKGQIIMHGMVYSCLDNGLSERIIVLKIIDVLTQLVGKPIHKYFTSAMIYSSAPSAQNLADDVQDMHLKQRHQGQNFV